MQQTPNMRVRGAGLVVHQDALLLVEYYDEKQGLHYLMPGGPVRLGETIRDCVRREALEEACLEVEVGGLVLAYEYAPEKDPLQRDVSHALTLVFDCRLAGGAEARLPDCPDPNQTAVRWVPLDELDGLQLAPPVQRQIQEYEHRKSNGGIFLEEWRL